jgi:hypothetical protein
MAEVTARQFRDLYEEICKATAPRPWVSVSKDEPLVLGHLEIKRRRRYTTADVAHSCRRLTDGGSYKVEVSVHQPSTFCHLALLLGAKSKWDLQHPVSRAHTHEHLIPPLVREALLVVEKRLVVEKLK